MNKRIYFCATILILIQWTGILANEKELEGNESALAKSSLLDISDQAYGIHDASNIRLFFENYGRFSRNSFSRPDAGEFPINSGHNYLYLMSPLVGVAPDVASGRLANVMQSRYTSSKDWDPVGGYHSPAAAAIAFSDKPSTWPSSVWFFQDNEGESHIVSDQDSYCVYNDDLNQEEVLGIQVAQTGYTFGFTDYEDMIFFKFEVTNQSSASYDSVYFGLYHDYDIGNDPGGYNDYTDDLLTFDAANNFLTVYDSDGFSPEWNTEPAHMGIVMLETPMLDGSMAGITDMHYGIFESDEATQMALLSSNIEYIPDGINPYHFFHTGNSGDIHFDDPGLIPSGGADMYGTISSGPFDLSPSDTLTFVIGLIAGLTETDLYTNLNLAQGLHAGGYKLPKPPPAPLLVGKAEHNKITLSWTNESEAEYDEASGVKDFEGYNLYKSLDQGLNWDQIDRNDFPETGSKTVPLISFDRVNGFGDDAGLRYTYVDSTVTDGFEYWYSITAFDHGDGHIGSLESPIGNTVEANNVISITPVSEAAAVEKPTVSGLVHLGGNSNYILKAAPQVQEQLSTYSYDLSFKYAFQNEIGNPGVWGTVDIVDSSLVPTVNFGFRFTATDEIDIINLDTQEIYWSGGLYLNVPYPFEDYFTVTFYQADTLNLPNTGDLLSLNFCAELLRYDGQDTIQVIAPQRFDPKIDLVSDDGLILSMNPQAEIQNINVPPVLDFEVELEVADSDSIQDMDYQITVTGSGVNTDGNTYIVLRSTDENSMILGAADTLTNGWGLQYRGVTAWIGFDMENPPPNGTMITFSTIPKHPPTIQDYYRFGIIDAEVNLELLSDELDQIRVVPNPYMAGSLWEAEYGSYRREPIRQIQFTNLPGECEIMIFTLSGDLIKTLEHNEVHGTESWDLRAEGGREIVSGIYLYQVKSGSLEYLNRFAVIK